MQTDNLTHKKEPDYVAKIAIFHQLSTLSTCYERRPTNQPRLIKRTLRNRKQNSRTQEAVLM